MRNLRKLLVPIELNLQPVRTNSTSDSRIRSAGIAWFRAVVVFLNVQSQGIENSSARIFSNPAGDYGSMVNERVGTSDWNDGAELGDTWQSRNSFSYGRCVSRSHGLGRVRSD